MTENFAKRLFVSVLAIYILSLFILSFLSGDLEIVPVKTAWTAFFIVSGVMVVSGIPWLILMKPHDRKVVLIGIAMTLTFYLIKMFYY